MDEQGYEHVITSSGYNSTGFTKYYPKDILVMDDKKYSSQEMCDTNLES